MIASLRNTRVIFKFFVAIFTVCVGVAAVTEAYFVAIIPFGLLLFYISWQWPNFAFWLLVASLPFSIEYSFSDTLGTDLPDEFLMIFVTGLFVFKVCYNPSVLSKEVIRHVLVILLGLTMIWAVLSSLFSSQPLLSLKFLLAKCWYIGAFVGTGLIVFRDKQTIRTLALVFVSAMLLVTMITMGRHSAYNFSFAFINDALQPFFRNHVNYSSMLVCVVPILYACRNLEHRKRWKQLIAVSLVLVLVALFLSYARGAWLALFTGAIAWWLIRKRWLVTVWLTCIIVVGALLFWLRTDDRYLQYAHDYRTTVFHKDFSEHMLATYQFKDVSTAERFYRWIAGVRMVDENPLTGFGPNTFYSNYRPYTVPIFKTWVSSNEEHSTVHNYFLLLAIEQGIPGLVFFLLLAGTALWYAERIYHSTKDMFYKNAAAAVGVILTMIMTVNFLSDLVETDKIGSLFFLALSLLVMMDLNSRKQVSVPWPKHVIS